MPSNHAEVGNSLASMSRRDGMTNLECTEAGSQLLTSPEADPSSIGGTNSMMLPGDLRAHVHVHMHVQLKDS